MKKPFFSIVIPTFNRCELLRITIDIVLKQTFEDFELIVSDNASSDGTEWIVKSFNDPRIKYFKNNENIGFTRNVKKAFSYAAGEYIFTLGDDDFILFEETLRRVKNILDKERFGFLRLNLIEKKDIGHGLRKSSIGQEEDMRIKVGAPAEEIIEFFHMVTAGHVAGLVIKNSNGISDKIVDCGLMPWVKIVFDETKRNGACFLANDYIVITWSQGDILSFYDVLPGNYLMFEKYADFIFSIIREGNLHNFKSKYYSQYVKLQPVIKLYSNNSNLIRFDRRLLQLHPQFKKNPLFWLMAIIASIVPRFIWKIVRIVQHHQKNILEKLADKDKILSRFDYLDKLYFSTKS